MNHSPFFTNPKDQFLHDLQCNSKYKYLRYAKSPIRYPGGKSLGVGHILEHIPIGLDRLVSPFIGGASVEIACANELNINVIGYDIFDILTNYWKIQLALPKGLYELLSSWRPVREQYDTIKSQLQLHWDQEKIISDNLTLAAYYWFNHNLSYGPAFLGWVSEQYMTAGKYLRAIEKVRDFNCENLYVETADFETVLYHHQNEFLYCDPPYYLKDGQVFKGIYPSRNNPVFHNNFKHIRLRELLHKHKGNFILSYNDCETIRHWYREFDIYEVAWQYSMGQGESRIGKNRQGEQTHIKHSHELLIVKS